MSLPLAELLGSKHSDADAKQVFMVKLDMTTAHFTDYLYNTWYFIKLNLKVHFNWHD